jgi:hypothetical protein
MEIVYVAKPEDYPVFHVQVQTKDGGWEYMRYMRGERAGQPISWQYRGGQEYATNLAERLAARGKTTRVVKRSPDEPLDAEAVMPLDPYPYKGIKAHTGDSFASTDPARIYGEFKPGAEYEQDVRKYPHPGGGKP